MPAAPSRPSTRRAGSRRPGARRRGRRPRRCGAGPRGAARSAGRRHRPARVPVRRSTPGFAAGRCRPRPLSRSPRRFARCATDARSRRPTRARTPGARGPSRDRRCRGCSADARGDRLGCEFHHRSRARDPSIRVSYSLADGDDPGHRCRRPSCGPFRPEAAARPRGRHRGRRRSRRYRRDAARGARPQA